MSERRLPVIPATRFFSIIFSARNKNELLLQRLFWGALIGCLTTFLSSDLPYLENMEANILEWQYKLASNSFWSIGEHNKTKAKDITLIAFDDRSQFELGIARFNDAPSQQILAQVIERIEKYHPAIVVIDIDLRGTVCPELQKTLQHNHNIVLALFGDLEGRSSIPSPGYLTSAAAIGYNDLPGESTCSVRQLPINYHEIGSNTSTGENTWVLIPSLAEAVINVYNGTRGSSSNTHSSIYRAPTPAYFSYRRLEYPAASLLEVLNNKLDPNMFKSRIVMVGDTLTPRQEIVGTTNSDFYPEVTLHADAISTLLDNEQIYALAPNLAKTIMVVLGAGFCALASILNLIPRTGLFIVGVVSLMVLSQISFQTFHVIMPTAPLLAVLLLCYAMGAFVHLNSDLRLQNKELDKARESMQARAEEERQRIAEDLHDETLPNLSAVARLADKLTKELKDNPIPLQMRKQLDFSVTEMRRVINDLHPSVLETMGFKPALENLLVALSHDGNIKIQFNDSSTFSDETLPKLYKLQLYRIVQECLNNIEKHAQATTVDISISQNNNRLIIVIADNGQGMPVHALKKESHGILNIKQRAQLINAQVDWKKPTQYQSGTEVKIELALNETQGES